MRLTYPTTLVLQALLHGRHHGFDIMDATGLPSGTVYPMFGRGGKKRASPGASSVRHGGTTN